MTTLTWWEVEELTSHLSSRPNLWAQSEDNENLWIRSDDGDIAFGLAILPPADLESPYRLFNLQEVPYSWTAEYTASYLSWLITNWTTQPQRINVEDFLRTELQIEASLAVIAAIAIESFGWKDRKTPEPPSPPT